MTQARPTNEELAADRALKDCQMIYRGTELAEYSGTAVPGNAETLSILASRGIWLPDHARPATEKPANDGASAGNPTTDEVARYIRKRGSKWVVYSEAGKALGSHSSKADAEKQLGAIEAHKHDEGRNAGESLTVLLPDGNMVTFATEAEAAEARALMSGGLSLEVQMVGLVGELRAKQAETEADVKAYIDLWRYGRV